MTELVPISRAKVNEKSNFQTQSSGVSNKTEDFNNIVVMSGSAKRRRLEPEKSYSVKISQKSNFKESFLKLRAPFCRTHQKHNPTEEKLMTKSCEILFECIKPYKDIRVARRTQVKESTRTIGSILTTDIIYERKATRKVQFVSFSGENRIKTVHPYKTASLTEGSLVSNAVPEELKNQINCQNFKTEQNQNEPGKTISSEDFVTNAFSEQESAFIW